MCWTHGLLNYDLVALTGMHPHGANRQFISIRPAAATSGGRDHRTETSQVTERAYVNPESNQY